MHDLGAKQSFQSGEVIIQHGDPGDCAYLIEEGTVKISIPNDIGEFVSVGVRGTGSLIGEMALIDSAPRTATIVAEQDCTVYRITKDDFSARLANIDPMVRMVIQIILARYRDTLAHANIRPSDIAVNEEHVELSADEQNDVVEKIKMANEFKEAIDNNKLTLHYQPTIDLKTGEIVGFESLMRWIDPVRGFVPPDIFIPIAEETGLILEASRWALKESCAALQRIEKHTGIRGSLFMAINFSSRDFASDGFFDSVQETLNHTNLKPEQVHVEITERLLIDQPEHARKTLHECRDEGMGIAIDDFGTGYSSLSYLHYFPIDTLKVDRSFIVNMHEDETNMALARSIVMLGQNLKMKTIAEGI